MDLLNKLNKSKEASAEGTADTQAGPSQSETPVSSTMDRGDDMINQTAQKASDSGQTAATPEQKKADDSLGKSSSGKEEPSGSETVKDPDSWTKESAFNEIKKLREENKAYRLKYSEQLEKIKEEQESREKARKAELEEARKAKAELERIKAEQEDKKRGTEEKLADREEKLAKLQAMQEAKEAEYQRMIEDMKSKLSAFEADREAEQMVHKNRLQEELNKIPESYREHAELLVRGAGDPRDALVALHEAKLKGMFEDKTTIVNHSVPDAKAGARASKDRLDAASEEQRKSMSSKDKIKTALEQMKSGQPNSAFRRN